MSIKIEIKVKDIIIAIMLLTAIVLMAMFLVNVISNYGRPIGIEDGRGAEMANAIGRNKSASLARAHAALRDKYKDEDVSIMMIDPYNSENNFELNADEVYISASTYKLFVAYSMLNAVEKGEMSWDSPFDGSTLGACFETMIVDSDNDCPEAWLEYYKSYDFVTKEVRDIGMASTCLGCAGGMTTTARDLANFLSRIYQGKILTSESRERLLEAMKRQIYRDGIPAGVDGNGIVADKVGFLDGLRHDAAIVYSNKGDYVLVVMTSSNSWTIAADVARTIQRALN
ncbi:class A beta-lactamase-related serine hydrolase [Candidatus Saccharibacteria bacterium]|nr:class A beta-lactamase-related serine hydrolase [Candidatus Saccharibacteria bacterium]MCL1963258.1 class A beta-lactamase-related serine hydrolase [Candidatus Saccharibacteria bacterium]